MRRFDGASLKDTFAKAAASMRLRANLNVHPKLDDPVQRMLNVFQPGTYVRAHRHEPDRFELFLVLSGKAAVLTFGDDGTVLEAAVLEPGATWAVELPGDVWHTVVSLAEDTALFEVKPGPYRPLEDKDYATWSPREGTPEAHSMLAQWRGSVAATPGASASRKRNRASRALTGPRG